MRSILIVDDDVTFALMLATWLGRKGFGTATAATLEAARRRLEESACDLVLTDMRLPDGDGTDLLEWLAGRGMTLPVIVMTGYAEIGNAVRCMKLGAKDYISKPVRPEELLQKIGEATLPKGEEPADVAPRSEMPRKETPRRSGASERTAEGAADYIEGRSDAARRVYEHVRLVAPTQMSVLIEGASGTGKEHVARLIHEQSRRAGRPFVAVDCGAIPRELAASEFFGHVKGSFTGALTDKRGAFEEADGGTLFLDEVGNLAYDTQVQLLRALQERRVRPVGGTREIPIDIRVVSATNERLTEAIARGSFRADLYHRLNEFTLRMPELRDTPDDIRLYADFFLDRANRELGKRLVGFDEEAVAVLRRYAWPGNIRQLKNVVMYATLLAEGDYVTCAELPAEIAGEAGSSTLLRDPLLEEQRIRRALEAAGGNKSQAAKALGIDRKTLYNKLRLYDIE